MRTKNLPSDKLQLKTGDPTELNHCDILFHCLCKHVSKGSYAYLSAVFPITISSQYKKKILVSETTGFHHHSKQTPNDLYTYSFAHVPRTR